MPNISISIPQTDNILNYELPPEFTIADLKGLITADTDISIQAQFLLLNGKPLSDTETLEAAGVKDNDMLVCAQRQTQPRQPAPAPPTGQPQTRDSRESHEIEQYRQRLLSQVQNPQLREQLRTQEPEIEAALSDPDRFRQLVLESQRKRQEEIERRNNDWSEESQAAIYEEIRQENVSNEAAKIMEENPELFGRVTMLYIDVVINGHPVKAFVDSGAQTTIMSPSCAEKTEITHLIDKRWSGVAIGVGTAKILGRVHRANMRIGDADDLPCSFTVMEGKDVDLLLGLDMLKRYQACIDLQQNRLVLASGSVSVPFLPESEIPQSFTLDKEPSVPGPAGTSIGATTGTVKPPPAASAAGASSSSASASKFQGQGQTLGAASAPSGSNPRQQQKASAPASASTPSAAPPRPTAPTPGQAEFPQASIDLLQSIGATREQAIEALRACDGNVDYAAGLLFDQ